MVVNSQVYNKYGLFIRLYCTDLQVLSQISGIVIMNDSRRVTAMDKIFTRCDDDDRRQRMLMIKFSRLT